MLRKNQFGRSSKRLVNYIRNRVQLLRWLWWNKEKKYCSSRLAREILRYSLREICFHPALFLFLKRGFGLRFTRYRITWKFIFISFSLLRLPYQFKYHFIRSYESLCNNNALYFIINQLHYIVVFFKKQQERNIVCPSPLFVQLYCCTLPSSYHL